MQAWNIARDIFPWWTHEEAEDQRAKETSDEALPSLLGGELKEEGCVCAGGGQKHIVMTSPPNTCNPVFINK